MLCRYQKKSGRIEIRPRVESNILRKTLQQRYQYRSADTYTVPFNCIIIHTNCLPLDAGYKCYYKNKDCCCKQARNDDDAKAGI